MSPSAILMINELNRQILEVDKYISVTIATDIFVPLNTF